MLWFIFISFACYMFFHPFILTCPYFIVPESMSLIYISVEFVLLVNLNFFNRWIKAIAFIDMTVIFSLCSVILFCIVFLNILSFIKMVFHNLVYFIYLYVFKLFGRDGVLRKVFKFVQIASFMLILLYNASSVLLGQLLLVY